MKNIIVLTLFALILVSSSCRSASVDENGPKLAYTTMLQDNNGIKRDTYVASYFPIRTWEAPRSFPVSMAKDELLLMMTERDGSERLLLIITKKDNDKIIPFFRENKKMTFSYTYVTVYTDSKKQYPLLRLVEIFK